MSSVTENMYGKTFDFGGTIVFFTVFSTRLYPTTLCEAWYTANVPLCQSSFKLFDSANNYVGITWG